MAGDWIKNLTKGTVKGIGSAAQSIWNDPRSFTTGLGVGAVKSVADPFVYVPGAVADVGSFLATQANQGQEVNLPGKGLIGQYEKFAADKGKGLAQGFAGDTPIDQNAYMAGQVLGELGGVGPIAKGISKIPGAGIVGQAIKGGVPGAVAQTAALIKQKVVRPSLSVLAETPIIKDTLDAGIKLGAKGQDLWKGVAESKLGSKISGNADFQRAQKWGDTIINPRSVTDRILTENPDKLKEISTVLGGNISNLDDAGDYLLKNIGEIKHGEEAGTVEKFLTDTKLDDFLSDEGRFMLHQGLTKSLQRANSIGNIANSRKMFWESMDKAKKGGISSPDQAEALLSDANIYMKSAFKEAENKLFKDPSRPLTDIDDYTKGHVEGIAKKLSEVDPTLGEEFRRGFKTNFVANAAKVSQLFKLEPTFGDINQALSSMDSVAMKSAQSLGLPDYNDVIKHSNWGKDKEWFSYNKNIIDRSIKEPFRNVTDAVGTGFDLKSNTILPKGLKDKLSKLPAEKFAKVLKEATDSAGYGVQQGVREQFMDNVVLPEALRQIRATGRFQEGSELFTRAVINHSKEMLRNMGMIPEEALYVDKKFGKNQMGKHVDDALKDMPTDFLGGKEFKSAIHFLSSWPKMAARGFMQSSNAFDDVVKQYRRSGEITPIMRQRVVNATAELVGSLAIFGTNGLRVAGGVQEAMAGDQDTPPETLYGKAAAMVLNALNVDTGLRRTVLDGIQGSMTGATASRTTTMPAIGGTLGGQILGGQGKKYVSVLADQILSGLALGTFGGKPLEGAAQVAGGVSDIIIPTDIERLAQAKSNQGTGSEILDAAGNPMYNKYAEGSVDNAADSSGMSLYNAASKNMPITSREVEQDVQTSKLSLADDAFLKKWGDPRKAKAEAPELMKEIQAFDADKQEKLLTALLKKFNNVGTTKAYTNLTKIAETAGMLDPIEGAKFLKENHKLLEMSENDKVLAVTQALEEDNGDVLGIMVQANLLPKGKEAKQAFIEKVQKEVARRAKQKENKK